MEITDHKDDLPPDESENVFHTRYSSDEPPSETVVRALAAIDGVQPGELALLYDSIDPEALDALFGTPILGQEEGNLEVEFSVSGYRVIVRSDGDITILVDTKEK